MKKDQQPSLRYKLHKIGKHWVTLLFKGADQTPSATSAAPSASANVSTANSASAQAIPTALPWLDHFQRVMTQTQAAVAILRQFTPLSTTNQRALNQFQSDQTQFAHLKAIADRPGQAQQALWKFNLLGWGIDLNLNGDLNAQGQTIVAALAHAYQDWTTAWTNEIQVNQTKSMDAMLQKTTAQTTAQRDAFAKQAHQAVTASLSNSFAARIQMLKADQLLTVSATQTSFAKILSEQLTQVADQVTDRLTASFAVALDDQRHSDQASAQAWAKRQINVAHQSMAQQFDQQLSDAKQLLRPEFQRSLTDLRNNFDHSLADLTFNHQQALSTAVETTQLATQGSVVQSMNAVYDQRVVKLRQQEADRVAEMQTQFDATLKQQNAVAKQKYQNALKEAEVKAAHELNDQLKALKADHQVAIEQLKQSDQQVKRELKTQYEADLNAARSKAKANLKQVQKRLAKQHQSELDHLKQLQVGQLKAQKDRLTAEFVQQQKLAAIDAKQDQSSAVSAAVNAVYASADSKAVAQVSTAMVKQQHRTDSLLASQRRSLTAVADDRQRTQASAFNAALASVSADQDALLDSATASLTAANHQVAIQTAQSVSRLVHQRAAAKYRAQETHLAQVHSLATKRAVVRAQSQTATSMAASYAMTTASTAVTMVRQQQYQSYYDDQMNRQTTNLIVKSLLADARQQAHVDQQQALSNQAADFKAQLNSLGTLKASLEAALSETATALTVAKNDRERFASQVTSYETTVEQVTTASTTAQSSYAKATDSLAQSLASSYAVVEQALTSSQTQVTTSMSLLMAETVKSANAKVVLNRASYETTLKETADSYANDAERVKAMYLAKRDSLVDHTSDAVHRAEIKARDKYHAEIYKRVNPYLKKIHDMGEQYQQLQKALADVTTQYTLVKSKMDVTRPN